MFLGNVSSKNDNPDGSKSPNIFFNTLDQVRMSQSLEQTP